MKTFDQMEIYDFEQVLFCQDKTAGLKAIIAIHDTTLGPALGGTRMWPYRSEEEALYDVLRLSRGMTYKAAAAGLNLGGGKAVIIGDPSKHKNEKLFRAFGRFVETLHGRYITAEDSGTCVGDMEYIAMETRHVTGVSTGNRIGGDPSPYTARGVWQGMKACAEVIYGTPNLKDLTVAVQGVGNVGYYLCRYLWEEGAKLLVSDINPAAAAKAAKDFGALVLPPQDIIKTKCDIFSPNALGAVINDETIDQLDCRIVAGGANNVLAAESHGETLTRKGILYAPDYVINAGGLIKVADELHVFNETRTINAVDRIYRRVKQVITTALDQKLPTTLVANQLAEQRIADLGKIRATFIS